MHGPRRAFSMMELVIVLAVSLLLTSLLFPALSNVRENLDRVLCSSNVRQLGLGTMMFAKDNNNRLPESYVRYLSNFFADELQLRGTPVRMTFRAGDNPYAGKRNQLTRRQQLKRRRLVRHRKQARA